MATLKRKLVLRPRERSINPAETINGDMDTLATPAEQAPVWPARSEAKANSAVRRPGAAKLRDLTDNVNRLAANLTTQARHASLQCRDEGRPVAIDHSRCGWRSGCAERQYQRDDREPRIRPENAAQDWLKTNLPSSPACSRASATCLPSPGSSQSWLRSSGCSTGVLRQRIGHGDAELQAGEPCVQRAQASSNRFRAGEGPVGQCAWRKSAFFCGRASKLRSDQFRP